MHTVRQKFTEVNSEVVPACNKWTERVQNGNKRVMAAMAAEQERCQRLPWPSRAARRPANRFTGSRGASRTGCREQPPPKLSSRRPARAL